MLKRIRFLTGFALAFVIFLALVGTVPAHAADANWTARYWNNRTLTGDPVLVRQESSIDHDWGGGAPAPQVNDDNFSVQWTRSINFSAGTYRFTATMDDGMRVWVDNNLIIDSWYDSQVHSVSADITLTSGDHNVRVEYYEAGGVAVARLNWANIAGFAGDWRGEYYNNMTLSGAPTVVRTDPQIDFGWTGAPVAGVGADMFSVRWTRTVQLDPGRYRFTATADDGVRLWVNNQLLIDQWHDQQATTYTAEVDLPGGSIPIQMDYYEHGGVAIAQLTWTRVSGPAAQPPPPTITNWRGEYFNNVSLNGAPVLVRDDNSISFVWGSSSPAPNVVNADRFSVRWTNTLNLNPGRYVFTVHVDDGARLWVNNQLIIDQWQVQPVTEYSAAIDLPGGQIPVRMEYFENTGLAEARLSWSQLGAAPEPQAAPGGVTATMVGARYLNVRSGPGLEFEPFTYLTNGQTVQAIGRSPFAVWLEIRLPSGNTGWVSSRYMASTVPFTTLPVTSN